MSVETRVYRFAGRALAAGEVFLGVQGDNCVRRVVFELPEITDAQMAYIKLSMPTPVKAQLTWEGNGWGCTVGGGITAQAGVYNAQIEVFDQASAKVWESAMFVALVAVSDSVNDDIAAQMLPDLLETQAALAELTAQTEDILDAVEAEEGRVFAESLRVISESARADAEAARVSAETARVGAESARVTAESGRVSAETARVSAESSRASAETLRVSAESGRLDAETSRGTAETARVTAEEARVTAETARASAEAARANVIRYTEQTLTDAQKAQARENIAAADGKQYRVSASTTYPVNPNSVAGYSGNAIIGDVQGATICGGGSPNNENIIGGDPSTVGDSTLPNVANLTGSNAHYSVIGGGYDNVNNAIAGVLTGYHCVIGQPATHGTISGGSYQTITAGNYATISGGTNNSIEQNPATPAVLPNYTTIAGGSLNTASGSASTVMGGTNNTASGSSAAVAGGSNNVASGGYSFAAGVRNTANGQVSSAIGGDNVASGQWSTSFGAFAKADQYGEMAHASGCFAAAGDAQSSEIVLCGETTDQASKYLAQNKRSATFLTSIPAGTVYSVEAMVLAHDGTDSKAFKMTFVAVYKSGKAAQIIDSVVLVTAQTDGAAAWTVSASGGSATLRLSVTGEASKTIRWVAKVVLLRLVM